MLGVTLACASLLLAVGGVGVASMPPVHNVALPSIASVYVNDIYLTGIRPVDSSTAVSLDTSDFILSVSIAGHFVNLSDGRDEGETCVYILSYSSDDGLLKEGNVVPTSYVTNYAQTPVVVFTAPLGSGYNSAVPIDMSLPDLTYWKDDGDGYYYLGVSFNYNSDATAGYYGLTASYADATGLTLSPVTPAELGADLNPISAIGDGLGVIPALGGGLTDGFDAVFVDNGALTAVGTFAFLLMGIGISVGIVKKCFNWVTGRHGM